MFKDRAEAGKQLAESLSRYKFVASVVYGLPRGGVVVAAEVAKYLSAPLGMIIARKIGHPQSPEYAIGAVTESGPPVWNSSESDRTDASWRENALVAARAEAKRRRVTYLAGHEPPKIHNKAAIVVDDGVATGLTLRAALLSLREQKPHKIVVAVPVAPEDALPDIELLSDDVVALNVVGGAFGAISVYYEHFDQVEDEEVRSLLDAYRAFPLSDPLDLAALNSVLATVKEYPATSGRIAAQARRLNSPISVVNFFESMPSGVEFKNKADVMRRSEQTEILMEEEAIEPSEQLRSYDE